MSATVPTDLLAEASTGLESAELGSTAEELGYDGLWLAELWGESAVVRLSELAVHTEEIQLGTAIANVFSRSPATLAMTAATLDRISDGRFRLGLGTSTRAVVEDLHGMDWESPNPVRRAHESIELIQAFLEADEPVEYEGQIFDVRGGKPLDRSVPIYHAALGEANRRVVARLCDGWLPHNVPIPDLEEAFAYIDAVADRAGRDADIAVAPIVPAAVGDDVRAARSAIRRHIAYSVGSGPGYRRAIAHRFPERTPAVVDAWQNGARDAAAEAVTEEMVNAIGIYGTADRARDRLEAITGIDCVSRCIVAPPPTADKRIVEQTMQALAPKVR